MGRVKLRPKTKRPRRAPPFEELDDLDKLLVRVGGGVEQRSAPGFEQELHSAPGFTVRLWLASPAGQLYLRKHSPDIS
jgi:hypothetical protein